VPWPAEGKPGRIARECAINVARLGVAEGICHSDGGAVRKRKRERGGVNERDRARAKSGTVAESDISIERRAGKTYRRSAGIGICSAKNKLAAVLRHELGTRAADRDVDGGNATAGGVKS